MIILFVQPADTQTVD